MPDDPKPGLEPSDKPDPALGGGNDPASGPDYWQKEAKAHAKEAQKLRERLNALEADKTKAAEDDAKKRGEFEQLFTKRDAEAKALEARLSVIETAQEAEFEDLIKDFTAEEKELIDASLPVEKRLTLARKLTAKLRAKETPGMGAGGGREHPKGKYGGYASATELAAKDWKLFKEMHAKGLV